MAIEGEKALRILIIGAGSIGLLLAGKLAATGAAKVELVTGSDAQAEQLNTKGIAVRGAEDMVTAAARAVSFSQWKCSGPGCQAPDWIFLTVKQQAIDSDMLEALQSMVSPACGLLCWQNGIGHVELISKAVPLEHMYIAVTTEGAKKLSPYEVAHTGCGITEIGPAAGHNEQLGEPHLQKKIADLLFRAGFNALVSKNIGNSVWNKLLVNAAINPITAITRRRNGELLESDGTWELIRSLAAEGQSAAAAEGFKPIADLELRIRDVCLRTSENRSSMLQDVEAGRRTENEWISGAIVRLAAKHGLAIPKTETVYRIIREWERGR